MLGGINPSFPYNTLKINKKGLLFLEQPSEKTDLNPICTVDGKFFEHLIAFLELLDTISQSNSQ